IDGAVLVLVDIDQLKRSEASLRDSQRKFSLLMEGGTGIAILMLDPDGRLTAWNSGAERLFQFPEAEVAGRSLAMLYDGADAAEYAARELDIVAREGSMHEEHSMRRRDGSVFWASGVLTPLHDEDGRLAGYTKV